MTIPQPPSYGAPAAPQQFGQPQQQQYNAVQYQPPAVPQYGQPQAPQQFGQPGAQPAQQVMPATVPSDQLPGWGQMMSSGAKGLPTKDANGNWIQQVWQGGVVVRVLPPRHRTAPREQGGAPLYFPDGQPKIAYPVVMLTSDRDPADPNDQGLRTDFIQSTAIKAAKTELGKFNIQEPEIGAVMYRMLLRAGGPGGTAKSHEWVYAYTPPSPETLAIAQQHNAPPVQSAPPPSVAAPQYAPAPAAAPQAAPAPQYAPAPGAPVGQQPMVQQTVPGAPYVPVEQPSVAAAAPQGYPAPQPGVPAAPVAVTQAQQQYAPPAAGPQQGQPSPWPYGQPAAPQAQPAPPTPGVPAPPQFPMAG